MSDPRAFTTPKRNDVTFLVRSETNDHAMVTAVVSDDEYGLADLPPLTGWALDVGAHVGSIAVALAVDHPELHVIAIEPLPENVELIRQNAEINGVADRVHIEAAAAGAPGQGDIEVAYYYSEGATDFELAQHRYVGNVFRTTPSVKGTRLSVPTVSIRGLAEKYGVESFVFALTDCETGEWAFFSEDSELCEEIRGERHDGDVARLVALLPHHDVTSYSDEPGIGNFRAVLRR